MDGNVAHTGSFEFAVNPLYTGAFTLGAMRTNLVDPTFGLVWNGKDSVVTARTGGGYRILYTLTYTPFIWGRRDLEVAPHNLLSRFYPSVGVVLNNVTKNAVIGLSFDMGSAFFITAGLHAGLVSQLDASSGVTLGSKFLSPSTAIPTQTQWGTSFFFGGSIDLRAAVNLLKIAAGTTSAPAAGSP